LTEFDSIDEGGDVGDSTHCSAVDELASNPIVDAVNNWDVMSFASWHDTRGATHSSEVKGTVTAGEGVSWNSFPPGFIFMEVDVVEVGSGAGRCCSVADSVYRDDASWHGNAFESTTAA
jgi:hypothetical protein